MSKKIIVLLQISQLVSLILDPLPTIRRLSLSKLKEQQEAEEKITLVELYEESLGA